MSTKINEMVDIRSKALEVLRYLPRVSLMNVRDVPHSNWVKKKRIMGFRYVHHNVLADRDTTAIFYSGLPKIHGRNEGNLYIRNIHCTVRYSNELWV